MCPADTEEGPEAQKGSPCRRPPSCTVAELGLKLIPFSQNFFHHLLFPFQFLLTQPLKQVWQIQQPFSVRPLSYEGRLQPRRPCGWSQSVHSAYPFSFSACLQEFTFSLPFFKVASTCANTSCTSYLGPPPEELMVCSVPSILGLLKHAWVLNISMALSHLWRRQEKIGEK